MQNIKTTVNGTKLLIEIDTAQNLGPSKSGKTQLVATTAGNQRITTPQGDITIGVNAYRKA